MTRTILYYPHINIRNQSWLKQAVLYWDNVGTIVPHEIEDQVWNIPTFQKLQEHRLLRFFPPFEHIDSEDAFSEEFSTGQNSG